MPVSTLPCPSRSSGLSRLVVDLTTRPLYQPQTIFKPHLNHLPTNIHRSIPNFIFWLVVNCLRCAQWEKSRSSAPNSRCSRQFVAKKVLLLAGCSRIASALSQQKCGLSQCLSVRTSVHYGHVPKTVK